MYPRHYCQDDVTVNVKTVVMKLDKIWFISKKYSELIPVIHLCSFTLLVRLLILSLLLVYTKN